MTTARASTQWHSTITGSITVLWIDGDEGTGRRICSVRDNASDAPAFRLHHGQRETLMGEPSGLVVLGSHKWDRPTVAEAAKALPEYEAEIRAIEI